jgi:hypothetical protein
MTVSSAQIEFSYVTDGVTTIYDYVSRVITANDVDVILNKVSQATGYTRTLMNNGYGGVRITFTAPPAAGQTLTLRLAISATQLVNYTENDPFPAEVQETALDKLTLLVQRGLGYVDYRMGSAVRVPQLEAPIPELPAAISRIGKTLVFDGSGNPTVGVLSLPGLGPSVTFNSIASMRAALPPVTVLGGSAFAEVQSYYGDGKDGGGPFDWDAAALDADDGFMVVKPATVDPGAPGRWRRRITSDIYTPEMAGAFGDDASDDAPAINKVLLYAIAKHHGTVLFSKSYAIASRLNIVMTTGDRLTLMSLGKNAVIRHLTDNTSLLGGTSTGGSLYVSGVIWHNFGDRNQSQGTAFAINLINLDELIFNGNEIRYSRHMSLRCNGAKRAWIQNNYIHHSYRDGINCGGTIYACITGNKVIYCGDDAIGAHNTAPISDTVGLDHGICIANNIVRFSVSGIRTAGGQNVTMIGNNLRFVGGTFLGTIYAPPEGLADTLSIVIEGNICTDLINVKYLTNNAQNFCRGILLQPIFPSPGLAGGHTRVVPPTQFSNSIPGMVKPEEAYWNYFGGNPTVTNDRWARGSGMNISVRGNTVMNRLRSNAPQAFSQFGYGQLWGTQGFVDPTMSGTMHTDNGSTGVVMYYAAQNVNIGGNNFYGVNQPISAVSCSWIKNVNIHDNIMVRAASICVNLSIPDPADDQRIDCVIQNNVFDLDPAWEHPDRDFASGQPTGKWNTDPVVLGQATGHPIALGTTTGTVIRGNIMKNCKRPVHLSGTGQCLLKDNTYYGDPSIGAGMSQYYSIRDNDLVYMVSDPRAANYGQVLSRKDRPIAYTGDPSDGAYWMAGQFAPHGAPIVDANGRCVIGWLRLTTGNGDVLGTNWIRVYVSANTWA